MDYRTEMLQAIIQNLDISVSAPSSDSFQIEISQRGTVFEPNDVNDSTVMVRSEFIMSDAQKKIFSVHMEVEFLFKFDPIPENWAEIVSQYCPEMMRDKSIDMAKTILQNMGHKFNLSS